MNCDAIARWYRWFEYVVFGRELERRRREYLSEVADAKHVLILGDGDGRFTAEFLRINQAAVIDSVDISAKMLCLARERIEKLGHDSDRVTLLLADARTITLRGSYDLVVSHFFLDCFTTSELQAMVSRLSGNLAGNARWLISEFRVPTGRVSGLAARLLIRVMYLFFRISTGLRTRRLPEYPAVLSLQGFTRTRRTNAARGLITSELWQR